MTVTFWGPFFGLLVVPPWLIIVPHRRRYLLAHTETVSPVPSFGVARRQEFIVSRSSKTYGLIDQVGVHPHGKFDVCCSFKRRCLKIRISSWNRLSMFAARNPRWI